MRHITHNSSNNSSLSSHNYLLLNQSKKSSIGEGSINIYKNDYNNKQNIKGTLKVNKVNFLTKCQSQKLFEDINIQYIEPLEGGEEESEEQDDGTYRRYLNPLALPSAGAPAHKYRYVNTETSSPGEAKGLIF